VKPWRLDVSINAPPDPEAPLHPTSRHLALVNVLLCDGAVRPLSQFIDLRIYKNLVTPRGLTQRAYPGFEAEQVLSGNL
jgi:hypothetical protein